MKQTGSAIRLDAIDLRILATLQHDSRITKAAPALDEVKSPVLLACLQEAAVTWTMAGGLLLVIGGVVLLELGRSH